MAGASSQQNPPCGQVHIDKDIETLEEDGVDAEEVSRDQSLSVRGQE